MSADVPAAIRILVADDHEIVREGIRRLVEQRPGWEICAEAKTGREAVALAQRLQPDVLVLDLTMPELNGLDATRQIKRALPNAEILLFTGEGDEALIQAAFDAGARSYILKTEISSHFLAAVEALSTHKPYFTPDVAEVVFNRFLTSGSGPGARLVSNELSNREREVVQLVVEGRSNKEVAAVLGISPKTVETHRAAIMRKLRLETFSELVRYAIRNKIIEA